jgi:phasin
MTNKSYEVPQEMREFAERSVEQARKAFEGFVGAAQKAAGQLEGATSTMQSSARDVSSKAMGFAEANIRAAFDHAQRLVRAKDLQEVMQIQSEYLKTQISTLQEQAKEIGAAVQKATTPNKS